MGAGVVSVDRGGGLLAQDVHLPRGRAKVSLLRCIAPPKRLYRETQTIHPLKETQPRPGKH